MRVLATIHALMAWAIVQCFAAPHLLMLLNSRIPSVQDLHDRDAPMSMILESKQLLRRDPAQSTGPAPFATVTSSYEATSSVSIEQIESSEGIPFRRDLDSVVAQNMPKLMQAKTSSGVPGFESFAEAVRQGLANGKRDLVKLFTRGLVARGSQDGDVAGCGGRLQCIKKREVSTRSDQGTDNGNFAQCGGRLACIKKRVVDLMMNGDVSASSPPVADSGTFTNCGGRLQCIKKRVVDIVFGLGIFKKRDVSTRSGSSSDNGGFPDCGGRLACIKKRVVDNFQLKRLLKHMPATPSNKSITKREDKPLAPREPTAEAQVFHTCDGGLCFDTAEEKVEKRVVNEVPRDATSNPQFWSPEHPCGHFECMPNGNS